MEDLADPDAGFISFSFEEVAGTSLGGTAFLESKVRARTEREERGGARAETGVLTTGGWGKSSEAQVVPETGQFSCSGIVGEFDLSVRGVER